MLGVHSQDLRATDSLGTEQPFAPSSGTDGWSLPGLFFFCMNAYLLHFSFVCLMGSATDGWSLPGFFFFVCLIVCRKDFCLFFV